MKIIQNKIKIHPLTYFFILSGCLTGMFQHLIALALIIIVHELGHIISIKIFKYEIVKVEFFPYGGFTNIYKDINSPIKNELIISISGILCQVILGIIMIILYNNGFIRESFYLIFKSYNVTIMVFNLLPITPLDGHIFFNSILELLFPYKSSNIISIVISFIALSFFIYVNIIFKWNNYIIVAFLIYKLIERVKRLKYNELRFYLERYLNNYNFRKIKIINGIKLHKMFKEKDHYFLSGNSLLNESEILAKKFDKGKYF